MFYEDDPMGDHFTISSADIDALDRADEEREYRLQNIFFWLTARERVNFLRKHPDFPGDDADDNVLESFAKEFRAAYTRRVPCKFHLGFISLSGEFDLSGGHAYILEDGRYKMAEDFNGTMSIEFQGKKPVRIDHANMFYGSARNLDHYDMRHALEELERSDKLPALRKA